MTAKFLRIPRRLTIETIYGCNASCTMCPIDLPSHRKKGLMPLATSTRVLEALAPHADQIDKLDFFGLGEPLLDPHLFARIAYAKRKGYRNIAISTNCELMSTQRQERLLDSGIDTVICSIDGATAATHEGIRRRTRFDNVVRNCEQIIEKRNRGSHATRFIVRFIRQPSNRAEWPAFHDFWTHRLSSRRNDLLIVHDMHDWGGSVARRGPADSHPDAGAASCHKPYDSLVVLANGQVPLCTEDWYRASYSFGNVNDDSPLAIFNSPEFERIRAVHTTGRKDTLALCRSCTIHASRRTIVRPAGA